MDFTDFFHHIFVLKRYKAKSCFGYREKRERKSDPLNYKMMNLASFWIGTSPPLGYHAPNMHLQTLGYWLFCETHPHP